MPRPHSIAMKPDSMAKRLAGSRFRVLNEVFYTETSHETQRRLAKTPQHFIDYHKGYAEQTSKWDVNPVTLFTDLLDRVLVGEVETEEGDTPTAETQKGTSLLDTELLGGLGTLEMLDSCWSSKPVKPNKVEKHKVSFNFTNLTKEDITTIGDMGCGEATLAQALVPKYGSSIVIHSYDFVAVNRYVTVANIRSLPLQRHQLDLAIYCLSLMGTDYISFIQEAYRVVRPNGELWVAETNSRIPKVRHFVKLFSDCGFRKIKMIQFTHFTLLSFKRIELAEDGQASEMREVNWRKYEKCLIPCVYKRR